MKLIQFDFVYLNMKNYKLSILLLAAIAILSCSNSSSKSQNVSIAVSQQDNAIAYFASGCFWCVEAVFESVKGVEEAVSGYSGGTTPNPNYKQVSYGKTDHAEAVAVYYNPKEISFADLVTVFFGSQDPTTKNQQGPDVGAQYRSIAFYQNADEKAIIEAKIEQLTKDKVFRNPIVTEVKAFNKFYKAEDYHQDYKKHHPNDPYVKAVSNPRLEKFKKKFPQYLKSK